VAISPVPIIAVILMLFSARAKVNGPMFLAGWVVALGVVSVVAYVLADAGDAASDETADNAVSWGQIAVGVFFLFVSARQWLSRPAPGAQPEMPKWMAGIDAFSRSSRSRSRCCLPASTRRTCCSPPARGRRSLSSADDVGRRRVVGRVRRPRSITIAVPVVYHLVGGERARKALDATKEWLAVHNAAVMTVLFLSSASS